MTGMFLTVIPCFLLFLLWLIPHVIGKSKTLPVAVWLENGRYHYSFSKGVLHASIPGADAAQPLTPTSI
jgi:hypothetical protein